jgi:hypothetical protein
MWQEPHVQQLAHHLRERLAQAQASAGAGRPADLSVLES